MRQFLQSIKNESRLFFGDADSYTIINNYYAEEYILIKLKLAVLMYDIVLMPAAFFWQSDIMSNIFPKIELLISNENILPVIRDYKDTEDIIVYFEKRASETNFLSHIEILNP